MSTDWPGGVFTNKTKGTIQVALRSMTSESRVAIELINQGLRWSYGNTLKRQMAHWKDIGVDDHKDEQLQLITKG